MPLDLTHAISTKKFIEGRNRHGIKLLNVPQYNKFNNALSSLSKSFSGVVCHRDNHFALPHLQYEEGNPNFNLYKASPNGWFVSDFSQQNDLWRSHKVNDGSVEKLLSMSNHKYALSSGVADVPDRFILVPLQRAIDDLWFAKMVASWAKVSGVDIVFKEHPCSSERYTFEQIQLIYAKAGAANQHCHFVDMSSDTSQLIDQCEAVWTLTSGVGFTALAMGKPVAAFADNDYSCLGNRVSTADEACAVKAPKTSDLYRFLSWYYNFCIDIDDDCFIDKLEDRMHRVFNLEQTQLEIFG